MFIYILKHFCCCGAYQLLLLECHTLQGLESGDLAFENEQGELHPLRTKNLRELLMSGDGETIRTKVAFVSACHSQEAGRAFVAAGVPHVVAVRLDSKV